jgi:hypothetical protein
MIHGKGLRVVEAILVFLKMGRFLKEQELDFPMFMALNSLNPPLMHIPR